jgi:hypothetical protein
MHAIYNNIYYYEDYRKTPFTYGTVKITRNILENMCPSGTCNFTRDDIWNIIIFIYNYINLVDIIHIIIHLHKII